MRKCLFLLLLFILPVVSATYVYTPNGVGQAFNKISGEYNYSVFYEIPENVLRTDEFYWDVMAGWDSGLNDWERENVTLNSSYFYNETHIYVRIQSFGATRTKWYVHNGTSFVLFKTTQTADDLGGCGSASGDAYTAYVYDNDFTTGLWLDPLRYWGCSALGSCVDDNRGAMVIEEGVWWNEQTAFDVVIYVRDPYQQYLSGVNVTLVREDGVVFSGVTDFSGAVLFELVENIDYNVSVVKSGYANFTGTMTAIESTYAITLGYVENEVSPWMGFSVDFSPEGVLLPNVSYSFWANSSSSYHNISGCWFSILDNESNILDTNTTVCNSTDGYRRIILNTTNNVSLTARLTLELNGTQNISWYYPYTVRYTYVGEYSLMVLIDDLIGFDGAGFGDDERWLIAIIFIFFITAGATMLSDIIGEPERIMLLVLFLTMIACAADFMPLSFVPDPWLAQYGAALLVGLLTATSAFISWRLN